MVLNSSRFRGMAFVGRLSMSEVSKYCQEAEAIWKPSSAFRSRVYFTSLDRPLKTIFEEYQTHNSGDFYIS